MCDAMERTGNLILKEWLYSQSTSVIRLSQQIQWYSTATVLIDLMFSNQIRNIQKCFRNVYIMILRTTHIKSKSKIIIMSYVYIHKSFSSGDGQKSKISSLAFSFIFCFLLFCYYNIVLDVKLKIISLSFHIELRSCRKGVCSCLERDIVRSREKEGVRKEKETTDCVWISLFVNKSFIICDDDDEEFILSESRWKHLHL